MSVKKLFLIILIGHILCIKYPFGNLYANLLNSVVKQNRRTEAVFHLNNRMNGPLNIKENCTLKYAFL